MVDQYRHGRPHDIRLTTPVSPKRASWGLATRYDVREVNTIQVNDDGSYRPESLGVSYSSPL